VIGEAGPAKGRGLTSQNSFGSNQSLSSSLGGGEKQTDKLASLRKRCSAEVSGIQERYADLAARGFHQGVFQTLAKVFKNNHQNMGADPSSSNNNEMLAALRLPPDSDRYHIHPAVLDGVFQLVGLVGKNINSADGKAWVPMGIGQVTLFKSGVIGHDSSSNLLRRSDFSFSSIDSQRSWPDLFGPTLSSVNLANQVILSSSTSINSESSVVTLDDGEEESFLWAHAKVITSNNRLRVMDFHIYDPVSRAVTLSLTDFRFAPLREQPPGSALYEVRWPELSLNNTQQQTSSFASLSNPSDIAILDLIGCRESTPEFIRSLKNVGLNSVIISGKALLSSNETISFGNAKELLIPIPNVENQEAVTTMVLQIVSLLKFFISGGSSRITTIIIVTSSSVGPNEKELKESAKEAYGKLMQQAKSGKMSEADHHAAFASTLLKMGHSEEKEPILEAGSEGLSSSCRYVGAGALWGLMRTARMELPAKFTVLSLDTDAELSEESTDFVSQLRDEISLADGNCEVAYRGGTRHCRKIKPSTLHTIGPVSLRIDKRGKLQNMQVLPQSIGTSGVESTMVQLEVRAVGLNFKDVLNVLMPDEAAYVGETPLPGTDFAGVVTALPADHSGDLVVGDAVYGMCMEASGMLRTQAVVRQSTMAKMPQGVSFEEAAHMPMVFLTVEFALGPEQANLKAGERLLVHSAAGGVGIAAIQYAQRVGAVVYATASAPKHDFLRSLGVKFISTSRDPDVFAKEMKEMVGDRGVDVVLNSLTSDGYIDATVSLVADKGRFIEIGKRNIWSHEKMKEVRPDIRYETHSLNELLPSSPERLVPMLQNLAKHIEAKDARPLPMKVFELRGELIDAFRCLQGGKNIGKVVVRVESTPSPSSLWKGDGSILITGGLGGLGIVTAEMFVELGVRTVVLASRSGKLKYDGQGLSARLDELRETGVNVVLERCDTGEESQVVELLERVRAQHGPLKGVVHAAGVLSDAMLSKQTEDSIRKVFCSKADGAWYLHKHTEADQLDVFMLYSSVASLFGNVGQANYSSANAYMDELARWRVSRGLAGLSIQWPAVSGVGMAAAMDERVKVDKSLSVDVATVKKVLKQLVCAASLNECVQSVLPRGLLMDGALPACVSPLTSFVKLRLDKPVSRSVSRSGKGSNKGNRGQGGGGDSNASSRFSLLSPEARRKEIFQEVDGTVKELLGLEDKAIDPEAALVDVGIDSLAGTQLVRELREKIGVDLEPTALFDYPSVNALTDHLTSLIPEGSSANPSASSNESHIATPQTQPANASVSFVPPQNNDMNFFDDEDEDFEIGADPATVAAAAEGKMAPVSGVSASVWSTLSPELRDRLQRAVEQAATKASPAERSGSSNRMRKVTEEFDDDDIEDEDNETLSKATTSSLGALSSHASFSNLQQTLPTSGSLSPPRHTSTTPVSLSPARGQASSAPVDRFGREPAAPPVYTAFSSAQQLCGAVLSACLLALGVSFGVRVTFGATFWAPQLSFLPRELVVIGWQLLAIPISLISSGVGICGITLLMKWLLLGKQVPCSLPMASHAYVRWWTVNIMLDVVNNHVLMPVRGSFILVWWLRLLGADIGENVVIDTMDIGDADLLVIGDGAVLQRDCVVRCSRVVPAEYRIALEPVIIGRHSVVGPLVHVVPSLDSLSSTSLNQHRRRAVVPDGCKLNAMSSTERTSGYLSVPNDGKNTQGSFTPLLRYRDQGIGLLIVLLIHSFSLLPSAVLVRGVVTFAVSGGGNALQVIASAISIAIAFTWLPGCTYCFLLVLVKKLFIGTFLDGENQDIDTPIISSGPLFKSLISGRFRYWVWSRLLGSPLYLGTLIPFSFTPVVPWYFRLLGAKIGKNVWMVPPNSLAEFDLLHISDNCFSGGDYALFPTGDNGISHILQWGEQSGVTDRAVCLSGTSLGSRSVVGDMTTVCGVTPNNSVTVGDPNMRFPLPTMNESSEDEENTNKKLKSSWKPMMIGLGMMLAPLILGPGLLLPGIVLIMPGMLFLHKISHETADAASCAPLSLADVSHLTIALVLVGSYFVIAFGAVWLATSLKRKLIGKIKEGRHRFGSIYMLKWTALNFSIIPLVHRLFTKPLRGSPFFNSFLRLNGAKVGHHVHYFGVLEASADFDMLDLGDRCCIDYNARLQAHEVIDAHVSHRPIKIGERVHIGSRSNLLAGSSMQPSSKLQDQSLLLGRSEPKPGQVWGGIPAALVKQPSALRSTGH